VSLKTTFQAIEKKVYAATGATTAVGVVIAVLNDVEANHQLLGSLPEAAQTAILAVIPGVLTFAAAWKVAHTPRPTIDEVSPQKEVPTP